MINRSSLKIVSFWEKVGVLSAMVAVVVCLLMIIDLTIKVIV